jgi:hypothetical protein
MKILVEPPPAPPITGMHEIQATRDDRSAET